MTSEQTIEIYAARIVDAVSDVWETVPEPIAADVMRSTIEQLNAGLDAFETIRNRETK